MAMKAKEQPKPEVSAARAISLLADAKAPTVLLISAVGEFLDALDSHPDISAETIRSVTKYMREAHAQARRVWVSD